MERGGYGGRASTGGRGKRGRGGGGRGSGGRGGDGGDGGGHNRQPPRQDQQWSQNQNQNQGTATVTNSPAAASSSSHPVKTSPVDNRTRRYACKVCSWTFSSSNKLKNHKQKLHRREKKQIVNEDIPSAGSGATMEDSNGVQEKFSRTSYSYKELQKMRRNGTHSNLEKLDLEKINRFSELTIGDNGFCNVCLNSVAHRSLRCPYQVRIPNANTATVGESYEIVCGRCSMACAHAECGWEGRAVRKDCAICEGSNHWTLECPENPNRVESFSQVVNEFLFGNED